MVWLHIAKEFRFEAAHRLYEPTWSEEENLQVFGKCSSLHGHSYLLEVQVGGRIDVVRGWVMDYGDLKAVVDNYIIYEWDHKFLNDLPPFDKIKPTAENIALEAFRRIEPGLPKGVVLERVRIKETATTFAEVTR